MFSGFLFRTLTGKGVIESICSFCFKEFVLPISRTRAPEIDEEQVKELHAKIGELAVANDFLSRKLKPWGVK